MGQVQRYVEPALPRVLFVDDEPGVRAAFARSMAARGFLVDLAADGAEAVSMASRNVYPVVATDLSMPGLDGFSMIEALRSAHPGTVFVVVTGQSLAEVSPVRTSDGSISRIIPKPWDSDDLAEALRRAFDAYQEGQTSQVPPPTVLLVERDQESAAAVWTALEQGGGHRFAVETVRTVEEAEERLKQTGFQAILTEIELDDCQGGESIRRLQAASPDTPVVILTGSPEKMRPTEAIRLGAQDFIAKSDLGMVPLDRAIFYAIERKRSEQRLAHLAHHDNLTGLPGRDLFQQRVGRALQRARRREEPFAVVLVDIDRFRSINDGLGQDGGDAILVEIGRRLLAFVESSETVARVGADEFAFVFELATSPSACARMAQRLLERINEPIILNEAEITVTGSVGIAIYPENGDSVSDLLASAETALIQAKQDGRDSYRLFGDRMQSDALAQLRLEGQLRRALEREEFRLYYQPQFEIETGKLVGVEALLRWERDGELVSPGKFIPALEDTSLIIPVGAWVLQQASKDLKAMHDSYGPVRMAVNLSARQFERDGLVEVVVRASEAAGISCEYLELEITESLLMRDVSRTVGILSTLREAGVRFAIDDFGTGYSSLAYLRKFPVGVLKVDRTFVNEMMNEGPSITQAIIKLGQTLGLEIVAEGVENVDQLLRLRQERCEMVQGYFCGRPVAFDGNQSWKALPMGKYLQEAMGRPTIEIPEDA